MSKPAAVTDAQILAAQGGDEMAMWDIVSAYEPLIWDAIRSVARGVDENRAEDLLQEGRIVLIQHVREYSTEGNSASLSSFAYRALRGAIAEEWIRMSTDKKVNPVMVIRVRRAFWEAEGDADRAFEIVSSYPDLTHRMSREAFVSVCEALMEADSLEAPLPSSDNGATLGDTIPDATSNFTNEAERRDLAQWLMTQIPQRQGYALRAFYGVGGRKITDEQASDELGLKSHKKCEALRQLRKNGVKSARNVAAGNHITLAA